MANIIHKIGETLGVGGGQKEGDKHAVDQHKKAETHQAGDYKEGGHGGGGGGIMDKVKNQIHGGSSADKQDNQQDKKKKDKKKDKKKHGDDKHGDSSSSDSD